MQCWEDLDIYYNDEQGMLETMHYVLEKWNIATTIVFQSGSKMLLVTASLASSLFLKEVEEPLNFLHVGETEPEFMMKKHYDLKIKGNNGLVHEVQCMEVDYIIDTGLV